MTEGKKFENQDQQLLRSIFIEKFSVYCTTKTLKRAYYRLIKKHDENEGRGGVDRNSNKKEDSDIELEDDVGEDSDMAGKDAVENENDIE